MKRKTDQRIRLVILIGILLAIVGGISYAAGAFDTGGIFHALICDDGCGGGPNWPGGNGDGGGHRGGVRR